jgi:hypothetical protein
LFNEPSIDCFTVTFNRCDGGQNSGGRLCKTLKPLASTKDSGHLAITEQLPAPLPDRLFCKISPQ